MSSSQDPKETNQEENSDSNNKNSESGENNSSQDSVPENSQPERNENQFWLKIRPGGKSYWDWLEVILIPVLLGITAGIFAVYANERQNEINERQNKILEQRELDEKDRNQQTLLLEYLDEISKLAENKSFFLNNESTTLRTLARARTLTVLRALDSDRKGELIQFLSAAELINRNKTIIDLKTADLTKANLNGLVLENINLSGVILKNANLQDSKFRETNFQNANFSGANLQNVDLRKAKLNRVKFIGSNTNLREANLFGAILTGVEMENANLSKAILSKADLSNGTLRRVDLSSAKLDGADLSEAKLNNSNLAEATLVGADLRAANFTEVKNINASQIKSACNWKQATFNKDLKEDKGFKKRVEQVKGKVPDCSKWK